MPIPSEIRAYNAAQSIDDKRICDALARTIDRRLPMAEPQDLAPAPGVVYQRQPDRRLQQAQRLHPPAFLERPVVRRARPCSRGQFQGCRGPLPRRRRTLHHRRSKVAQKVDRSPVGLQEHRQPQGPSRANRGHGLAGRDARSGSTLLKQAVPELVEEVKWRKPSNSMLGVPVWSHRNAGMVCTGETYKNAVKLTFANGAGLPDPSGLFNASLEGNTRRAIDLHEGDAIDAKAFKALVRSAAAPRVEALRPPARPARRRTILPLGQRVVALLERANGPAASVVRAHSPAAAAAAGTESARPRRPAAGSRRRRQTPSPSARQGSRPR